MVLGFFLLKKLFGYLGSWGYFVLLAIGSFGVFFFLVGFGSLGVSSASFWVSYWGFSLFFALLGFLLLLVLDFWGLVLLVFGLIFGLVFLGGLVMDFWLSSASFWVIGFGGFWGGEFSRWLVSFGFWFFLGFFFCFFCFHCFWLFPVARDRTPSSKYWGIVVGFAIQEKREK